MLGQLLLMADARKRHEWQQTGEMWAMIANTGMQREDGQPFAWWQVVPFDVEHAGTGEAVKSTGTVGDVSEALAGVAFDDFGEW